MFNEHSFFSVKKYVQKIFKNNTNTLKLNNVYEIIITLKSVRLFVR